MAKKNFLLLSLDDKKANKVANVVSNASCKKILDYLSENEGTESEISKKLGIPLSTVHYNLNQLMDAGLVDADEYHYSEKGKEVYHYKLANKYIVIAPKSEKKGLSEKLKSILPVGLLALGVGFVFQFVNSYFSKTSLMGADMAVRTSASQKAAPMVAESAAVEEMESARMMDDSAESINADTVEESAINGAMNEEAGVEAAQLSLDSVPLPEEMVQTTVQGSTIFPESIALWFFLGSLFTIITYLIITRKK